MNKILLISAFCLLITICSINAEDATVEAVDETIEKLPEFIDFNLHHKNLLDHGDHKYLKKYLEIPEPDLFLNADAIGSRPIKMVNFTEKILPFFNNWDEKTFTGVNYLSAFTFGDLQNEFGVQKTNLNSFFESFKPGEGNALNFKFPMPGFIR